MGTSIKTFVIDMDGTICSLTENQEYYRAKPDQDMINKINNLYNKGHCIKIFTARGMASGNDFKALTLHQLHIWDVKFHELIMGKPSADYYVDDKSLYPEEFKGREFI